MSGVRPPRHRRLRSRALLTVSMLIVTAMGLLSIKLALPGLTGLF